MWAYKTTEDFEPLTTTAALSSVTDAIGLVVTGSATLVPPFHLVSEELLLDRHWRNARTLASHNPRVYKARILGDWLINGKDPLPNIAKLGRGGQGN